MFVGFLVLVVDVVVLFVCGSVWLYCLGLF